MGGRVVLKGTGYGSTREKAKKNAMLQLSQAIIANVKSSVTMKQEEKDGRYSESLSTDVTLKSDLLLKGVKYSAPQKEGKEYKVVASMTVGAVKSTLGYLVSSLPSNIDNLSENRYDDVLTSIYLIHALLFAVSEKDIPFKSRLISTTIELRDEILKRITFGSVRLMVNPSDARIKIDGKPAKNNRKVFLSHGNHTFRIEREGYRSMKGQFFISRGDKLSKVVDMMKKMEGKVPVYLRVEAPVRIVDDVEKVLLDFGLIPTTDDSTYHGIVVKMRGTTITVGKYRKYKLEVDLHSFKNKQKYKITHYEHKPFFVTPETEKSLIRNHTKKVATAVVRKFLTKIDLADFLSKEESEKK